MTSSSSSSSSLPPHLERIRTYHATGWLRQFVLHFQTYSHAMYHCPLGCLSVDSSCVDDIVIHLQSDNCKLSRKRCTTATGVRQASSVPVTANLTNSSSVLILNARRFDPLAPLAKTTVVIGTISIVSITTLYTTSSYSILRCLRN
jgi:hypothetical protein